MGEEWKFSQCFGEKVDDPTEADILSAVEFDHTGDYLATGDKGGRIVIFERHPTFGKARGRPSCEYRFYADFQSHEAEFDYLKSLEIEEKINKIRWCRPSNGSHLLLSTNDKTVKLWRIYDKKVRTLSETNVLGNLPSNAVVTPEMLRIPRVQATRSVVTALPRRVFSNAHAYHINSISVNSDGESYLSADDLRINLWNLGINNQSFNIVDIKPNNMEELTEVITASEFHPSQCNVFTYSSSKGSIKLGDMRAAALCDSHAKMFEEEEELVHRSFFSEIIASISDIKFTSDGRYIVSRDYLTLKIWDLNMEARPVQTIQIHEPLRSKLCELYENDCIFDKFEVAVSGDGNNMATGSYDNLFHIYDRYGRTDTVIEASKSQPTKRGRGKKPQDNPNLDFSKKMLHLTWHPQQNIIAAATLNNLYIYCT